MTLKPGNYPIGSAQSRAAARILAHQRQDLVERLDVILSGKVCRVSGDSSQPRATAWMKCPDGKLMRGLIVPDGMTTEEPQRRVDSPA